VTSLPLKLGTPSKNVWFGPKYICAKFGALGYQVTIIAISRYILEMRKI